MRPGFTPLLWRRQAEGPWQPLAGREVVTSADRRLCARTDGFSRFAVFPAHDFSGFLGRIANAPATNVVEADDDDAVPLRFSIGGDYGTSIIAPGYPRSTAIECGSDALMDGADATRSARKRGLQYNRPRDRYTYKWAVSEDWAGTCRQFVLKLWDGASHSANFRFTDDD